MREIKFRAYVVGENCFMSMQGVHTEIDTPAKFLSLYGDNILMQFTGLLDKNGKEIYESDIVRFSQHRKYHGAFDGDEHYERTFIIEWREGGFWGKDSQIKLRDIAGEFSEVIGNIYENPDLLKL